MYDANGNQTEIKEKVGEEIIKLRPNLWDEENPLIAVDLKPDYATSHPIAIYTYNAAGERIVRYSFDRFDVRSSSNNVAEGAKNNIMIYPSGLVMGRVYHTKSDRKRIDRLSYTKHCYIGSERVSGKTCTINDLGFYPRNIINSIEWEQFLGTIIGPVRTASNTSVGHAQIIVRNSSARKI